MKEAYVLQNIVWINAEVLLPPPDTPVLIYCKSRHPWPDGDYRETFYVAAYDKIKDEWYLVDSKRTMPRDGGVVKAWTFMHAPDEFKEIFKEA